MPKDSSNRSSNLPKTLLV